MTARNSGFLDGVDSFGRLPCPGCKTPIVIVTHLDKPGSPDGLTTVDIDFWPMAEHMSACPARPEVAS